MSLNERNWPRLPIVIASALAIVSVAVSSPSVAEVVEAPFDGPKFKRGLWRFDRTLAYRNTVRSSGSTRCVDPTTAMKGIFASPDVGNCRSDRAVRVANNYRFENRCDYMGPVRTLITVHSAEAYTELNTPKGNRNRPVDKVVAHRLGDCDTSDY